MNRHGLFCALIAFSVAAGCGQLSEDAESKGPESQVAAIEPMPTPNTQSPDNVIKSYWAFNDWARNNTCRFFSVKIHHDVIGEYERYVGSIGADDYLVNVLEQIKEMKDPNKCETEPSNYQRDITEVKLESETRSLVLAKVRNIAPIPDGVTLTKDEQTMRRYGRDVKYIVEKTGDGWRLTQAWYRDLDMGQMLMNHEEVPGEWDKAWESPAEQQDKKPSSINFYWVHGY